MVFLGGAGGTVLRYGLTASLPRWSGVPVATLGINVVGSFLLGLLLEQLTRRGLDRGRRRAVRLFLGPGLLGGFTTYSALAVDTDTLLRDGRVVLAVTYAVLTVLLGLLAAWTGIRLGRLGAGRAGDAGSTP